MNEYMMGYRWLHVDVEGDVQRGDAVRESAAGYVRHAGLTDVVAGESAWQREVLIPASQNKIVMTYMSV